jgi:hypothetical protein
MCRCLQAREARRSLPESRRSECREGVGFPPLASRQEADVELVGRGAERSRSRLGLELAAEVRPQRNANQPKGHEQAENAENQQQTSRRAPGYGVSPTIDCPGAVLHKS